MATGYSGDDPDPKLVAKYNVASQRFYTEDSASFSRSPKHMKSIQTGGKKSKLFPPQLSAFEDERFKSRCCFCFMAILFGVVVGLMALSIAMFAVKETDVKMHCNVSTCPLTCDYKFITSYRGCALVYGAEGLVCVISSLFIVSLLIRTLFGLKL